MDETINNSCIICFNNIPKELLCITNCNHIYCKDCLNIWFDRGERTCPMCRENIKSYENNGEHTRLVIMNNYPEDRIVIETINNDNNNNNNNNIIIANLQKKIGYMKFYFGINLIYVGYLQYHNILCNT